MSAEREQLDEWARCVAEQAERMGATEHLRAAVVRVRINRRRSPLAPDLPSHPAGADEPEADPPQRIAADPSVFDSESDPSYRDRVHTDQSEAERQAWLRRVQAQPIR